MTDVDATFVAEYDYKAQGDTELTINAGDTIRVSRVEGEWLYGRHNMTGKEGWVAASYGHLRQESPYQKLDEKTRSAKRKERFAAILTGETDFLTCLKSVVENVISVINVRDTSFKRSFLQDPAVAVSFNLLSEINKACSSFHQVLVTAKSDVDICTAYTHFAPSLQLFAQYASENSKLLHAVERNRRDLAQLFGGFNLAASLIQPLEHYPLYKTEFQDYVWLSPQSNPNYELLCSAVDAIIAQSEFVDVKLKEEAESLLLLNLQNKFSGNPVIFTPSRRLLKEAEIERVREKSTGEIETKVYYAHLFNDAMIYSSRSRVTGGFKLHTSIDFKGARFELHEIGGLSNGFTLFPADKGGKAEHFRMQNKEEALEWFPLIINQIEVLKTKRIERRSSTMIKSAVNIPGVKIADLGPRCSVVYKFLLSELQFAEATTALNMCMIQPLIDASKGAVLSAAALNTGEDKVNKKGEIETETVFDSRAAATSKYQSQIITEALQEPDILIFLRAAEGIALASREFCRVLESLCGSAAWKESLVIGNQFTSVNALALYNQLKSYAAGQQAMVRVLKTPPFAQFYKDAEQFLNSIPGTLAEKIELPRKRIKNYLGFITELKNVTPADHSDAVNVAKAIETVEAMNAEVEELLRIKKNFECLLAIQASLVTMTNEPVVQKLVTMDRTFIKEGDLKKVCRKKNKTFRFWLFSDIIIYGGALGGDKYSFNRALDLHKCSVAAHKSSDLKNAIEIFGAEKSFVVIAATQQQCDEWIAVLKSSIDVARKTKGLDAVPEVLAPLWTPDHSSSACPICSKPFTMWNRRHHCRKCGTLMCSDHLNHKELIPHLHKTQKQKICDDCHAGRTPLVAQEKPISSSAQQANSAKAQEVPVQRATAAAPPAYQSEPVVNSHTPATDKPTEVRKLQSAWPPEASYSSTSKASSLPASTMKANDARTNNNTSTANPIASKHTVRSVSPPPATNVKPVQAVSEAASHPLPTQHSKPAWPPSTASTSPNLLSSATSSNDADTSGIPNGGVKKITSKFGKRTSTVASKIASAHATKAPVDTHSDLPHRPPPAIPPLPPPLNPDSDPEVPPGAPPPIPPPLPNTPPPLEEVDIPLPPPQPVSVARPRPPPPPPPPSSQRTPPPPPPPPVVKPLQSSPAPVAPPAQAAPADQSNQAPDEFFKYRKMKEMLPEGAVRQKMMADGFRADDIEAFLSGKINSLAPPEQQASIAVALQAVSLSPSAPGPAASSSAGSGKSGNNLLSEILSGPKLKSVSLEPKPSAKLQGAGGILGMLAEEMSKRRVNITAAADDDDDSDSSGFSDSDSESEEE